MNIDIDNLCTASQTRVNLSDSAIEPSDDDLQMLMESVIAQVRIDAEKSDIAFFGEARNTHESCRYAPK